MRLPAVATLPVAVLATALCLTGTAGATEIGAYRGPGCDGRKAMAKFETFIGRKAERTVDALNAESWREMRRSIPWIVKCWSGSGIALTLSVPMLPRGGGSTLREGADGAYDQVFLDTARALVRYGQQDAIVRIGWEFNGDWVPWAASKDPEAYKLYFRRIVETMRSVPGQAFLFEWCPNHGRHAMDPTEAYPGDDVVDVIGKPTSYPEWGVGDKPDGHGVGDDPVFIAGMADWFEEAKPLYQSYWDVRASDYNARMSDFQFPAAAEMFQRRFGAAAVHSGN